MISLFAEESIRTRFSFVLAAERLGMRVIGTENAARFSSFPSATQMLKEERLTHAITVLCEYGPDVIVLRHKREGAAKMAARVAGRYGIPVINAGDGAGQHPTQALLDLYAIRERFGRFEDLTVAIGGDLKYGRTAHSLVYLLAKFPGTRFTFISPRELSMKEEILQYLQRHKVPFQTETILKRAIREADVVYWTRIQRERLTDPALYERVRGIYRIELEHMRHLKKNAILLHPMPIGGGEIAAAVDRHPQALYFKQAGAGVFVRMALLCYIFGV